MWLPTANNRRFAMSDELAQDDEGFEIADFGNDGMLDSDDEDEEQGRKKGGPPAEPRYDTPAGPPPQYKQAETSGTSNSGPAQAAAAPRAVPRESLDGETMFAVGDEDADKWSDDEDDEGRSGEGKGLVGKSA